jgi:hypothetical protein
MNLGFIVNDAEFLLIEDAMTKHAQTVILQTNKYRKWKKQIYLYF